jgi:3-dehydroquinate synthase
MATVTVETTRTRKNYDIIINSGAFSHWFHDRHGIDSSDRIIFLADATVSKIYGYPDALPNKAFDGFLLVEPGETRKNLAQYAELIDSLLGLAVDRKTVLVALGGGVTGDIVGFIAATLLRGVRFVQVPTTLLAQVDSSVGGKTGVNTASGKNLVGVFHQPECVVIDPVFLDTLPKREYLAGLAEVAKYGIIGDAAFFQSLADSAETIASRDHNVLAGVIRHCCAMKAEIVSRDETEHGDRALLNLGHTFGHALEALAGYDGSVIHGEAVAVGMALACEYAVEEGALPEEDCAAALGNLRKLELPTRIPDIGFGKVDWANALNVDRLASALLYDKKADGGTLNLILPTAIGKCGIVKNVSARKVASFMMKQASFDAGRS